MAVAAATAVYLGVCVSVLTYRGQGVCPGVGRSHWPGPGFERPCAFSGLKPASVCHMTQDQFRQFWDPGLY